MTSTSANAAATSARFVSARRDELCRAIILGSFDDRLPRRRGCERRVDHEREEPREVEVEPVGQHGLEPQRDHPRQPPDLQHPLAPRPAPAPTPPPTRPPPD